MKTDGELVTWISGVFWLGLLTAIVYGLYQWKWVLLIAIGFWERSTAFTWIGIVGLILLFLIVDALGTICTNLGYLTRELEQVREQLREGLDPISSEFEERAR